MNTPDRIFPSCVVAEHTNQIRRFNASFNSVVAKLKKTHTAALSQGGGYYTDMDQKRSEEPTETMAETHTAPVADYSKTTQKVLDMNSTQGYDLRETILKYAIWNRRASTKIKRLMKEADKEAKAQIELKKHHEVIRQVFNVSPRSCCPKLFRAILSDRGDLKHNKPLSHMVRPTQRMLMQKKEFDRKMEKQTRINEQREFNERMFNLNANSVVNRFEEKMNEFESDMVAQPADRQKRVKEIFETFTARKLRPLHVKKTDFSNRRKTLEEQIDAGSTFSHLSEEFPVPKKWRKFMDQVKKTKAKINQDEYETRKIMSDLKKEGFFDERELKKRFKLLKFQSKIKNLQAEKARKKKFQMGPSDDISINLSQMSEDKMSWDSGGEFPVDPKKDFVGVETNLPERKTLAHRRQHIIKARSSLQARRSKMLEAARERKREEELYGPLNSDDEDNKDLMLFNKEAASFLRHDNIAREQSSNKSSSMFDEHGGSKKDHSNILATISEPSHPLCVTTEPPIDSQTKQMASGFILESDVHEESSGEVSEKRGKNSFQSDQVMDIIVNQEQQDMTAPLPPTSQDDEEEVHPVLRPVNLGQMVDRDIQSASYLRNTKGQANADSNMALRNGKLDQYQSHNFLKNDALPPKQPLKRPGTTQYGQNNAGVGQDGPLRPPMGVYKSGVALSGVGDPDLMFKQTMQGQPGNLSAVTFHDLNASRYETYSQSAGRQAPLGAGPHRHKLVPPKKRKRRAGYEASNARRSGTGQSVTSGDIRENTTSQPENTTQNRVQSVLGSVDINGVGSSEEVHASNAGNGRMGSAMSSSPDHVSQSPMKSQQQMYFEEVERLRRQASMQLYRCTRQDLWKERFRIIRKIGHERYAKLSSKDKLSLSEMETLKVAIDQKEQKAKKELRKTLNSSYRNLELTMSGTTQVRTMDRPGTDFVEQTETGVGSLGSLSQNINLRKASTDGNGNLLPNLMGSRNTEPQTNIVQQNQTAQVNRLDANTSLPIENPYMDQQLQQVIYSSMGALNEVQSALEQAKKVNESNLLSDKLAVRSAGMMSPLCVRCPTHHRGSSIASNTDIMSSMSKAITTLVDTEQNRMASEAAEILSRQATQLSEQGQAPAVSDKAEGVWYQHDIARDTLTKETFDMLVEIRKKKSLEVKPTDVKDFIQINVDECKAKEEQLKAQKDKDRLIARHQYYAGLLQPRRIVSARPTLIKRAEFDANNQKPGVQQPSNQLQPTPSYQCTTFQENIHQNRVMQKHNEEVQHFVPRRLQQRRHTSKQPRQLQKSADFDQMQAYTFLDPNILTSFDSGMERKIVQNDAVGSNHISNDFNRNQKWHNTLNCPYYGLVQLRRRQDSPINAESNNKNLFRSYSVAYGVQRQEELAKAGKVLIKRNKSRRIDGQVYSIIDKCIQTQTIAWQQIAASPRSNKD